MSNAYADRLEDKRQRREYYGWNPHLSLLESSTFLRHGGATSCACLVMVRRPIINLYAGIDGRLASLQRMYRASTSLQLPANPAVCDGTVGEDVERISPPDSRLHARPVDLAELLVAQIDFEGVEGLLKVLLG